MWCDVLLEICDLWPGTEVGSPRHAESGCPEWGSLRPWSWPRTGPQDLRGSRGLSPPPRVCGEHWDPPHSHTCTTRCCSSQPRARAGSCTTICRYYTQVSEGLEYFQKRFHNFQIIKLTKNVCDDLLGFPNFSIYIKNSSQILFKKKTSNKVMTL